MTLYADGISTTMNLSKHVFHKGVVLTGVISCSLDEPPPSEIVQGSVYRLEGCISQLHLVISLSEEYVGRAD
ncbi:UNVERIFIED_CONTAM: hypothetical protein Sradi_4546600 [Sesamum radiatum]|uniref:Uncharacterized protein n=1 Tax=Sesamum radiatum TaxID=300843 RepID=A0AAW2NBH1_SESRA